jgi:hypothetical protein
VLVRDGRPQPADGCRDDGRAAGLRLQRYQAERLAVTRYDDDSGGAVPVGQRVLARGRLEADDRAEAEPVAQIVEGLGLGAAVAARAADDRDDKPGAQARGRGRAGRRRPAAARPAP